MGLNDDELNTYKVDNGDSLILQQLNQPDINYSNENNNFLKLDESYSQDYIINSQDNVEYFNSQLIDNKTDLKIPIYNQKTSNQLSENNYYRQGEIDFPGIPKQGEFKFDYSPEPLKPLTERLPNIENQKKLLESYKFQKNLNPNPERFRQMEFDFGGEKWVQLEFDFNPQPEKYNFGVKDSIGGRIGNLTYGTGKSIYNGTFREDFDYVLENYDYNSIKKDSITLVGDLVEGNSKNLTVKATTKFLSKKAGSVVTGVFIADDYAKCIIPKYEYLKDNNIFNSHNINISRVSCGVQTVGGVFIPSEKVLHGFTKSIMNNSIGDSWKNSLLLENPDNNYDLYSWDTYMHPLETGQKMLRVANITSAEYEYIAAKKIHDTLVKPREVFETNIDKGVDYLFSLGDNNNPDSRLSFDKDKGLYYSDNLNLKNIFDINNSLKIDSGRNSPDSVIDFPFDNLSNNNIFDLPDYNSTSIDDIINDHKSNNKDNSDKSNFKSLDSEFKNNLENDALPNSIFDDETQKAIFNKLIIIRDSNGNFVSIPREYVDELENVFEKMDSEEKKDIEGFKINEKGKILINGKEFDSSNILSNFTKQIKSIENKIKVCFQKSMR